MKHHKGLLRGSKFSGTHSTVIDSAILAVEAAKECGHVTKIALGLISPCRPGPLRIKFTHMSGGLKMQIRGVNAVQLFWVYTTEPESTILEITAKWNSR